MKMVGRDKAERKHFGLLQQLASLFKTYAVPKTSHVLPGPYHHNDRKCWTTWLPDDWASDEEAVSKVALLEDGQPLGPAHASHADVRALGKGRYSHWGTTLYFSTSDDTDPNTNGRIYSVIPPEGWMGTLGEAPSRASAADDPDAARPETTQDIDGLPAVEWMLRDVGPDDIHPQGGHRYSFSVNLAIGSDEDDSSTLVVLEDGAPLAHPHATHADIERLGEGRYSHWGDTVYFSASDNTDPRRNGRAYRLAVGEALLLNSLGEPLPHDAGHCWQVPRVPERWVCDKRGRSRVVLLEDGRPLGPGRVPHDEVRELGQGRYSHWETSLFFSTSDNTDPNENGRTYTLVLSGD